MKLNQANRIATPFGDFKIDVENLVDHFFGDLPKGTQTGTWAPQISISENETTYQLVVELAGIDPDNVSLEMQEGRLEIAGEKSIPELAEGFTSLKEERTGGSFKRVFEFPQQVEPDQIKAEFKNGVLSIVLPKSEKVLPRKIKINVSE